MFDGVFTHAQYLDIFGIILEITGIMLIIPQLVKFFIKIDAELNKPEVKKSFKRLMFAYGFGFIIVGLLMQLLSVLATANNYASNLP
ncbi:MAG: hypothetical protein K8Q89_01950 [Nitrosarchaeum sp.]|nr:hypothetical protein [Nitrosarchaeum sp.]